MKSRYSILPKQYRDSVSLMKIASNFLSREGIKNVSAVMATPANLEILRQGGLLEDNPQAGPNDLIIAASGSDELTIDAVLKEAVEQIMSSGTSKANTPGEELEAKPLSLGMALDQDPEAQLALISTPGNWAAHEAMKALKRGLHVMIFSDNVLLKDEVRLKQYATEKSLLVMGPDCGTAIIGGVPLAFANSVRRGPVGIVGASGTGTQQVSCLVHNMGSGISHAIGTGGHDLSESVGGLSMLQGIKMLTEDPETKVIVLVSKPPATDVAQRIINQASRSGKPVVVNFLGLESGIPLLPNLHQANTLEQAAVMAVSLAGGLAKEDFEETTRIAIPFQPCQRYIRGLFSGGTFCFEAAMLLKDISGGVVTNTPIAQEQTLTNPWESRGHTLVDLGDDVFTRGRPHPMIDPTLRLARLEEECNDPETAVILLDVVLGFGAHDNPAGELAERIKHICSRIKGQRKIAFVASLCGTDQDFQGYDSQKQALIDAGIIVMSSNARAVILAKHMIESIQTV